MSIFPVCLLVCLLLVQVVAPETTEESEKRFREFVRQHIIEAMEPNDCTTVMANRSITKKVRTKDRTKTNETKGPKKTNTFIIANENEVKAICHGQTGPKKIRSANKFNITVCNLTDEGRYEGTKKYYQIIVVECENNLPVHFHDQIKGNE
ncbi:hypothetical protein XENOCAPTIV_022702 [Xenoophorus captivus]|uniref:Ribonuclease A-domain domain-containing protein n=1 Tax=Xenoophorus captivus TaxID=1517983 RepID=A0ABV0S291_9TELE